MSERRAPEADPKDVLLAVAASGVLLLMLGLLPTAVVLAASGDVPPAGVVALAIGTVRIAAQGRWSDPARAYPDDVASLMPEATTWWLLAGAFAMVAISVGAAGVRVLEPHVARERLGRRPGDLRGARPRSWARPRDLPVKSGDVGFRIGRLDGREVCTGEEEHVAVIAPTRSGKTTRCVIPWLLEHRGPAIVTSTKRDVLEATLEAREHLGNVWVYDPFSRDSAQWSPLDGCQDWSCALRTATWLADATQDGDSEIARYWRGEASKLLAPMLHAAALSGASLEQLIAWLDVQDVKQPARVLAASGAMAGERQLHAVVRLDTRNKGTTFMSAGSVLSAYRFPEVLASAQPDLCAETFATGQPHTLYVVSSERHQRLLTPLIVALLSGLLNAVMDSERFGTGRGPRLRVLLDEAANIAPLTELPRLLSQAAGHGIRVATVWQSLGQMQERFGRAADTILANSTSKLFMGPVTDEATRTYVDGLLGRTPENGSRKVSSAALQQLHGDRALLVTGAALPSVVTTRPWWNQSSARLRLRRHRLA